MNFALDEEQRLLRDSVEAFLRAETRLEPLLVPGASVADAAYEQNWQQIVDLGWTTLSLDEAYEGAGLGIVEMAVLATELGRYLFPCPLAGHSFASWALQLAGSPAQRTQYLPAAAAGSTRLAFVSPMDGNEVVADANDRLFGLHRFVIDAGAVDHLVVAARCGDNWALYLVEAGSEGLAVDTQPWRDITREVCAVGFSRTPAQKLELPLAQVWPELWNRILTWLAAENAGGMRRVMQDCVEYANERMAFGRPIGAYQAIKHSLAEMLSKVEAADAVALFAGWAVDAGDARANEAASMAKAMTEEDYVAASHRGIQIFGAIGFTWEMHNHLYFKRARANAALFGGAAAHRDRVVAEATGRTWAGSFNRGLGRHVA